LEAVLKSGQVALLFDAFDELEPARRQRFLIELGHIRDAYPQTRIVLTSRPESGILSCDWLHPYSIAPLERGDVEALIRIYSDPAEADAMLHQLKCARNEVMALLAAPIFIALVVMKFRHTRNIPQN